MRKRMLILPVLAVVLALASVAVDTAEGAIIKGPYLMYEGSATEMAVLWQLDNSTPCTIEWGLDENYLAGSDTGLEYGDYQQTYTIGGLSSGTKYYYRITASDSSFVETGSFTTAPASTATDVKFLAFGDTRAPGANQEPTNYNVVCGEMLNTILADPAYQTMTLHVGDWIYENTEHDWDWFFYRGLTNALDLHATVPIQGCIGNHEGAGTVYEKYYPYPYVDASRFYWSFDYGPAHIAIVDQYTSFGVGSAQYNWLEADLAGTTKEWKILVLHEPGWAARSSYNSTVRTDIQPLCEQYGVDIVFGGHAHFYSRCDVPYAGDPDKFVHHIVTGGGGAPLSGVNLSEAYVVAAESTFQFCEIDIQGPVLTLTARRVSDAGVIDTFTVSHVDIYPPTAGLIAPLDNGPDDLDPDDGEVTVNTTQPVFDIQLSDVGDGIDDATVLSATVDLTKDSVPLVEGTDYSVGYDAGLDVITLAPAGGDFGNGLYAITLSGIADLAQNPMAATTLSILIDTSIVPPVTVSFQQGVDGYIGMVDTMIRWATGDDNYADSATQYYGGYQYQYNADTDSGGGPCQILLRFDGIIGPGQIPAGSTIVSATLRIRSTDDGNGGKLHRILQPWVDTDITWNNSFGSNGIQADDTEAAIVEDDGVPSNSPDTDVDFDVTATVQGLADGAAVNNGWAILPNGTNGWHVAAAEHPTLGYRPELIVEFITTGNQPPTVSITSPSDGATFSEYDNITITADASDADGTVTTVEFYEGGNKLGEDTAPPYSYTWNSVPAGSYSLTAKATDDEGLATTSGPVNITVNPPNRAPVAVDDSATTQQDTAVTIDVLANDTDADGDPLTVDSVTDGTYGSVVNNGGDVTYTPTGGYIGDDTFTYTATDGSLSSSQATVTVTVTGPEPVTLFSDGFESGNFTAGWTTSGDCKVVNRTPYAGSFTAKIKKVAWIEKAVSTLGYEDIAVKYARKTKGFDTGEWLFVEWYDGSSWYELESTQDTTWSVSYMTCGSGANDNSGFRVRFRTNTNREEAYIDAVEITGTPLGPVNNAPSVTISTPADGATFDSGVGITFTGTATDAEDGDLTGSLTWWSNIDGPIGSGASFTAILADGDHIITASVTDSGGETGSASVGITVGEPPPDTTPPSAPTGLVATPGDSQVSLDWDDNTESDLAVYYVYRSETSGSGYSFLYSVSESAYVDSSVTNGTTYYYVVSAVDGAGNESGYSTEVSATPEEQPGDVVTITKAEYKAAKSELNVEATSSEGGAVLTVEGYGMMIYDSRKNIYKLKMKPASDPGGTVTVTSTLGGSDTASVTYK